MKLDLNGMSKKDVTNLIAQKEKEISILKDRLRMHNFDDIKKGREQYKKQKQLNKDRGEWAMKNIVVGDIIKVTGSRNTAHRKVLNIKSGGVLVDVVRLSAKTKNDITEHMWDKITHVARNGKLENIKDLLG
jgi:hypothetical protein